MKLAICLQGKTCHWTMRTEEADRFLQDFHAYLAGEGRAGRTYKHVDRGNNEERDVTFSFAHIAYVCIVRGEA